MYTCPTCGTYTVAEDAFGAAICTRCDADLVYNEETYEYDLV